MPDLAGGLLGDAILTRAVQRALRRSGDRGGGAFLLALPLEERLRVRHPTILRAASRTRSCSELLPSVPRHRLRAGLTGVSCS
jgi:hypothetical protein